jgi:Spy/CpxP family protein refolding chaperone
MKKLILLTVCVLTISTTLSAQASSEKSMNQTSTREKMTVEQRAQKNVDELNTAATLSDDQKLKIKDFAVARITKVDAIKAKYKGQTEHNETMNKEISAVRKQYRENVKTVLTPEQLEKVKAKNKASKSEKNTNSPETPIDSKD